MSLPLPPDLRPDAPWRQRFRSPSVLWASVAPGDPDRAVACINRDGAFQIYALDLRTDELRQLSFREEGLANASLSADGRWLLYLQDEGGNEVGHHFRIPWEGGEPQDLVPGLAPYASFAQRGSVDGSVFATIAGNDDGYDLVVSNLAAAEPSPRIVWSTANVCFEAWPSADGSLAVIPVATHSDMLRFDLVAIDVASGAVVGELWDGEGTSIDVTSGSPVPVITASPPPRTARG